MEWGLIIAIAALALFPILISFTAAHDEAEQNGAKSGSATFFTTLLKIIGFIVGGGLLLTILQSC